MTSRMDKGRRWFGVMFGLTIGLVCVKLLLAFQYHDPEKQAVEALLHFIGGVVLSAIAFVMGWATGGTPLALPPEEGAIPKTPEQEAAPVSSKAYMVGRHLGASITVTGEIKAAVIAAIVIAAAVSLQKPTVQAEAPSSAQVSQIEDIAKTIASQHNSNAAAMRDDIVVSTQAVATGKNVRFQYVLRVRKGLSRKTLDEFGDEVQRETAAKVCAANDSSLAFDRGLYYTLEYANTHGERLVEFDIDKTTCLFAKTGLPDPRKARAATVAPQPPTQRQGPDEDPTPPPETANKPRPTVYEETGLPDPRTAFEQTRAAAKRGDVDAKARLGQMYYRGEGIPKDPVIAMDWLLQAAMQGNAFAQASVGWGYWKGDGMHQDSAMAAKWHEKAATQGNPHAQANLGMQYHLGDGVTRDEVLAYAWLRLAAPSFPDVEKLRDEIGASLTAEALTEAEALATDWIPGRTLTRAH